MGLVDVARRTAKRWMLPAVARQEASADHAGQLHADPGPQVVVRACLDWLCRAQDRSASNDGGVARDFSLVTGWATSYPETTGYIAPTMLDCARRLGDDDLRVRGRRMLDWMVGIQYPEGGFQGGKIDAQPRVPVTFNTGQILLGLAAGVEEFGEPYVAPMNKAAAWLRDTLDADGCWRRYATPFAAPGEKAYETHVSWGLFEAARLAPGQGYGEAGLRQVDWALTKQRRNGWFESCCLTNPLTPLTHTIGYVLRGVIEAYRYSQRADLLERAERTARSAMTAQREDGSLPGFLDENWKPAAQWACLTGIVQIASCWLLLHGITGRPEYREAAIRANAFVRRTIHLDGSPDVRGGVKGSYPVDGDYGPYQYLNWAAKFCIDANLHEMDAAGAGG